MAPAVVRWCARVARLALGASPTCVNYVELGGREGGGGARGCVGEWEWRVRVDRWGGDNVRCVVGGECSPAGKAFGRRWGYRMGECWGWWGHDDRKRRKGSHLGRPRHGAETALEVR